MNAMEERAAQSFADKGYNVTRRAESKVDGTKTSDLHVDGLGKVEVYSPQSLSPDSIVRKLEYKRHQASMFMVQSDITFTKMEQISRRIFGKPDCKHIIHLYFDN